MHLTPQSQAVMLLTVSLGSSDSAKAKALSKTEWLRFAQWLKDNGQQPADLLKGDVGSLLAGWTDSTVTATRVRALLERGAALGFALERWERAGLWVLTRSDPEYPERLKQRLRGDSPPVLFGCGNRALLNGGGVAVVGSRDAAEEDLSFTRKLGMTTARQGYAIVSGGARGVDRTAMLGALETEGTAIGVLAENLIRSVASSEWRKYIGSGDLVLVTPFNPEAGFNVGNAMARNRYIYCLSDAAIVVTSAANKGGTWNGAIENLKHAWVPLWTRQGDAAGSGNPALVKRGARWLPNELRPFDALLEKSETAEPQAKPIGDSRDSIVRGEQGESGPGEKVPVPGLPSRPAEIGPAAPSIDPTTAASAGLYATFLAHMADITSVSPLAADDIARRLELQKSQVHAWLKRAMSEHKVKKVAKPVRYRMAEAENPEVDLFGNTA